MKLLLNLLFFAFVVLIFGACRPTYEVTDNTFYQLNKGALLVRLYTKSKTIESLKKQNPELAEKVKFKQEIKNAEIVDAFKKEFKICPVYYFYSDNSKQIKEKQFEGVLLDENLNPLKQIPELNQNYFIAEFSYTRPDTITIKGRSTNNGNVGNNPTLARDDNGELIYDYYSSGMEGGVDALIVLSPEFIQLQAPYPHYIRTYENMWILKRAKPKAVRMLNQEIEFYLSQYQYNP